MAGFTTPVLASSMLANALLNDNSGSRVIKSGCQAIDQGALNGGFRHGEITAIAGCSGTGKTTTALHATATHLVAHRANEASLIDTTGFFSPLRMRDLLVSHLASPQSDGFVQDGYVYHKTSNTNLRGIEELKEAATEILARIKVMRVVDLVGVIEAIHEVGEICKKSEECLAFPGMSTQDQQKGRTEIPSSQDEEETTLDNVEPSTEHRSSHRVPKRPSHMVLIDNITNHASVELSCNQVAGQALLTTCMRSLRRITKQYNLCAIVINSIIGTRLHEGPQTFNSVQEQVSIFTSVYGKPALGKTFAHLIDTSLLISKVPASKKDAERAMNQVDGPKRSWKSLLVMEVLYDRYGDREGRWGAFDVREGLELVSAHETISTR